MNKTTDLVDDKVTNDLLEKIELEEFEELQKKRQERLRELEKGIENGTIHIIRVSDT